MKRGLKQLFVGIIALGVAYFCVQSSTYLAATRIYQVDECQNVYVAKILATGGIGKAYTNLSLYQMPLAWLARDSSQSVDLFSTARLYSLAIFWVNLVLITLATGERLLSGRGLIAFAGAATLAPLWDYGFEIRHDNLLLTGLLSMWCLVRVVRGGLYAFFFVGALVVAMQFTAFKAFVYTLPLTLGFLLYPPPWSSQSRRKLVAALVGGAFIMCLLFRITYGAAGLWELFVSDVRRVFGDATGNNSFAVWATLNRLLTQTPLLIAMLVAGLLAVAVDLRRRGKGALVWEGWLPEAFLLAIAFVALMLNPAPFAYNLVNLVPFIFLFVYRYAIVFLPVAWESPNLRPPVLAILVFAHLFPFGIATRRHFDRTNFRQSELMELAERLTDPSKDRVYDGVGMVPTRSSIHFKWFLHSLNIQEFRKGEGPCVRDMLAAQPASVIIPNYRTDWLPEEDHEFIREHYVPLADDFWVLGKMLQPGGGAFEIIYPGRYQVTAKDDSCIAGTGDTNMFTLSGLFRNAAKEKSSNATDSRSKSNLVGTLDGVALTGQVIDLAVGTHQIQTAKDIQPALVWLGPKLQKQKPLPNSDRRRLFVNWY